MTQHLPLAGIRVLDCSRVYAGPIASMLLGDMGAEIWKVEPPAGDETRGWGPPYWGDPDEGRSAYFASVNRNKRSMVINLKTDAGRALLDRLAAQCDLLLHNYQPSVARRLGFDPDRLRTAHPHLVVVGIGGFPGSGEAAERPAYDLVAQALSGLMAVTGDPAGDPMKVGVALLDLTTGLQAAIAALAGLLARERTRPEQALHASVSLIESGVTSLTNVLGYYLATGEEPRRWGNGHPDIVPYQVFAALDGHLVIAVGNDAQFERLIGVLGLPADPRFATNGDRLDHRDELVPLLSMRIAARARDELVEALTAADVPGGPVNSVGEALAFMQAGDPEWVTELDGIRLPAASIMVDGARLPARLPPPRLGEHTDQILLEAGLQAEEIEAFREAGALG
jgi:crotonobetainyl-CoA:carnitine CoA-transferase CaiB-like acyl-CoA transferase